MSESVYEEKQKNTAIEGSRKSEAISATAIVHISSPIGCSEAV